MFEEPVRFLLDVFQHDRPVLDLLYAKHTFVNPVLAKHYGMPAPRRQRPDAWVRVDDATVYGRGGLLPMAAFLTKNAPGLRTSPVKRGNWVVKNVLGEHISPPPADRARAAAGRGEGCDLPLREMLERHRADPQCAACHAKFDAMGLVFEGYGPIGERRDSGPRRPRRRRLRDFPGGSSGAGVDGLRRYIRAHRQQRFRRQPERQAARVRAGPQPAADRRAARRRNEPHARRPRLPVRQPVESIVTSRSS